MYKSIILDCQTTEETVHCEDCIVFKNCKAKQNINREKDVSVSKVIVSPI